MKTVIFGKGERLAECARVLGCEPSLSKYSELVILPIPTTKDGRHLAETDTTLRELAATVGEEAITLEDVYEPYLMQIGFLSRTPRGRCVTRLAYEHLGLRYNKKSSADSEQLDFFKDDTKK